MLYQEKDIVERFTSLANELGLRIGKRSEDSIEFEGESVGLKIEWRVERARCLSVGFFRLPPEQARKPRQCSGLSYLVEFKNGTPKEIEIAKSDTLLNGKIELIRKYAKGYLCGDICDFDIFEKFVAERVAANLPPIPDLKKLKFLRPEWLPEGDL